jgi:hypothetical protein
MVFRRLMPGGFLRKKGQIKWPPADGNLCGWTCSAGVAIRWWSSWAIAIASLIAQETKSAIIVGCMVFLSVFLSYFQEARSSKAVEKLQKMVKTTVNVVRDGREMEVPLEDIVPGDIVVLAAGSLIPADMRILSAKDFYVSQSALTGESMPVEKNADPNQPAGRGVFDFSNACFMGSNVLSGADDQAGGSSGSGTGGSDARSRGCGGGASRPQAFKGGCVSSFGTSNRLCPGVDCGCGFAHRFGKGIRLADAADLGKRFFCERAAGLCNGNGRGGGRKNPF